MHYQGQDDSAYVISHASEVLPLRVLLLGKFRASCSKTILRIHWPAAMAAKRNMSDCPRYASSKHIGTEVRGCSIKRGRLVRRLTHFRSARVQTQMTCEDALYVASSGPPPFFTRWMPLQSGVSRKAQRGRCHEMFLKLRSRVKTSRILWSTRHTGISESARLWLT